MGLDGKRPFEIGLDKTIDSTGMRSRRDLANALMRRARLENDTEMGGLLSRWADIFSPNDAEMQTGGNDAPSMRSNHPEHVLVGRINAHMRRHKTRYGNTEINLQDLIRKETNA